MMGARIADHRGEWFDIWFEDKKSIISTMYQNMASDLKVGYDPMGQSIRRQQAMIAEYQKQLEAELDLFKTMEDAAVDRWCFYDMKKRGAIE